MALAFGAPIARELGDVAQARRLSSRGLALSGESGYYFLAGPFAVRGRLGGGQVGRAGHRPRPDSGRARLARRDRIAGEPGYFLSYLAEALLLAGRIDEGIAAVDEALALSHTTFTRNYEAELQRLRGELLLAGGQAESPRRTSGPRWPAPANRARSCSSGVPPRASPACRWRAASAAPRRPPSPDAKPTAPRV